MRRRAIVLLGIAVAAVLLVGLAAAFVYTGGRWGCPSQAELERAREPEEVLAAFADDGIRLVPATLPPGALLGDRRYRGAQPYRYVTKRAALFVLVCKVRCGLYVPPRLRERPVPVGDGRRQPVRQISGLGNNVVIFMTDDDRRSGRRLQERVQPVVNDLDVAHDPDSRCYIH